MQSTHYTITASNSAPGNLPADTELRRHFRYPAGMVNVGASIEAAAKGFFQFGSATCFGHSSDGVVSSLATGQMPEATEDGNPEQIILPFSLDEVADNLRRERYIRSSTDQNGKLLHSKWIRGAYYAVRKFLPVQIRKHLQRAHLADWQSIPFPKWPVDLSVDLMFEEAIRLALQARGGAPIPFVWFWPNQHSGCLILTHDVEEAAGRDFCPALMDLVESANLRSSFQIVPEGRYETAPHLLDSIRKRGHEVNVHDLNHDGHLFRDRGEFLRRAARIRHYLDAYGANGFRSAVLYRNPEWFDGLGCAYDMSMPNVAHLDPQRGGCCTSFPYFIGKVLEVPLTTTQDYSLFHILRKYSLELWEQQIELILQRHGLVSFNVHPDYITEKRALAVFVALLSRLASLREKRNVWAALPGDVNLWWRQRGAMELVCEGGKWRVTGQGAERATLAYATLDGNRLSYQLIKQ